MEINNDMRLERFEKGSVIQQNLYSSPEAGSALRNLATKYNIPEESYLDFVTEFGDVVLDFYPVTALENNMRNNPNLSSYVVLPLISELQALLKPLIDTKEEFTVDTPTQAKEAVSEIKKTEESLEKVSRLRTMATDGAQVGYQSAAEPIYTSVQSAILNESK